MCVRSADGLIKKPWYIYTMEYYSVVKRNHEKEKGVFESVLIKWMNLEPIIQSVVSQKEKKKILF